VRRLLAIVIFFAPIHASAQLEAERDPRAGWPEIVDPDRRVGRLFMREGLRRLLFAMGEENPELGDPPRHLMIEQALLRFERAARSIPDDAELAHYTAFALTEWSRPGEDGGEERRTDEAIDAWHRLRAIDPSYAAAQAAFHLGVLHMQRQEFELARAEYEAALTAVVPPAVDLTEGSWRPTQSERALQAIFASPSLPQVHSNLAEAAMLIGDLDAAVTHFRATVRSAGSNVLAHVLALWGLALALDRHGSHDEALRRAHDAIEQDPVQGVPAYTALSERHGPFAVMRLPGVFFEPRCEIHAYEALGHEAMARDEGLDVEELRLALRSWRFFLAEGGSSTRYAAIARAHVERLTTELNSGGETPRAARRRARGRAEREGARSAGPRVPTVDR
jgi:tetratricopeptide (TPR) repeat protein